jgi:hypothetical protein
LCAVGNKSTRTLQQSRGWLYKRHGVRRLIFRADVICGRQKQACRSFSNISGGKYGRRVRGQVQRYIEGTPMPYSRCLFSRRGYEVDDRRSLVYGVIDATVWPCIFHVSPRNTAQSQVRLSSSLSHSIVPRQRQIRSCGILIDTRCMMSYPKHRGKVRICSLGSPKKIPGFTMPVSRRRVLY